MTSERAAVARAASAALASRFASPRWEPLPHQVPPPGNWYGWLLLAGRGAGKTDACANYITEHVNGPPCLPGPVPHWIGIIGPTQGDAVTSCVNGPSGLKAHDPRARLVTTAGGTVVRWPNGSEAKIFGAHTPEEVERLRSGGNRCVAEGTLVRTETGPRPIESIRPGDRVWTRNGLRRVLRTWNNGVKEVQRFDHGAGFTWLTPDHRVWTVDRWKQASLIRTTDTVLTWENTENLSFTTESTGTPGGTATTRTRTEDCCTGTCTHGRSAPSQPGSRSTTRTTTNRTTGPEISSCSVPENTGRSTETSAVPTGTVGARTRYGLGRSTGPSHVSDALLSSSRGEPQVLGSVRPGAERLLLRHEHRSNGCVACAVLSSSARPEREPAPVRASALRSTPMRSVTRVYDLTVEHDHEFFAGDLLVSNCAIWAEEISAWRYLEDCWNHMRFGLRAGPRPHWVGSTTPKPKPLIKKLMQGLVSNVVLTTGVSTYDNPHLPQHIRDALEETYAGTQLGSQELLGRLLEEDENALWTRGMLDLARVDPGEVPDLVRIVVGVDPSGGAGEQGIVVAGKSGLVIPGNGGRPQHHGYVLDDRTCRLSPDGWGRRAIQAATDWEADEIAVETNYGGAMAVATIRAAADALGVNIPIRTVTATRGKAVRAQPVSALTAQNRWHHAGVFPELEDQLTTWHPELGWSPDRLDAMVWTTWQLKMARAGGSGQGTLGGSAMSQNIGGSRVR